MFWLLLVRSQPYRLCSFRKLPLTPKYKPFVACLTYTTDRQSNNENERTVEKLYKFSVDIKKIRRLKGWVLLEDKTYVEEIANILQELGASETSIAHILECCPEAIVCSPTAVDTQRELWQLVCKNKEKLVKLIKQFPESFFIVKDQENQKLNIQFFQELGLKNVIISRFLTTAPNIFLNPVERNKQMIKILQQSYLNLGGSEANMKVWLLKLLSQNPFILLNSSAAIKETLEFLQEQGFTNFEILQFVSKLKGFIFQLCPRSIQNSISFSKNVFKCTDHDLRQLILKCPALLYYSVTVLDERIQGLLKEGISIAQIREAPMVLELTPQIIQYRIRKLNSLGYRIMDRDLANLNGTKKEFEASFGKMQAKKGRPVFNPVAPLNVEE
ncbi:transcription termination factor 2, mitochondrial [Choloepus didactylus]|uniref:transcription termination factor 2, mitochondrial n=1 Tax=Choloepus didactylus TaxID=27675 RepID=UPI0018A0283B|nr:transcription termination factor 2, mitochondrial [Choloepus didactylus]XP_037702509.1 transcription termination factor 2, mitochondrial [Choloepus didactylus]XP_037702510.1 transcription termination factor 2, mitochondrial [Choloepus didactylus]XP_037702511.1 transcription termination factor 2, mitochondrial [Choloepus didactylus]XP_037702512.1 transcription termination factor 2, mitochondrial [Choloepus didactylus]XP_037702513.1 transcription termination factor 2, mitochondrial [Choloepus